MDSRLNRQTRRQRHQSHEAADPSPPPAPLTLTLSPPAPCASASTSSVNTYNSLYSDMYNDSSDSDSDSDCDEHHHDHAERDNSDGLFFGRGGTAYSSRTLSDERSGSMVPATLPPCSDALGIPADPTLRPSDPATFARLFPSLDRLDIRHDDASPDGNMNLRVETVVTQHPTNPSFRPHHQQRRPQRQATVQLFHLRMHNLARREFSLRRYCRDSGREVCSSKRAYVSRPLSSASVDASSSPSSTSPFAQSVSAALRSVKMPFRRPATSSSSSSTGEQPASSSSQKSSSSSIFSRKSHQTHSLKRRGSSNTSSTTSTAPDSHNSDPLHPTQTSHKKKKQTLCRVPTDTMKLEFSNYARVDVRRRRGPKSRYEYDWWGHGYVWKREVDGTLGTVSYHLFLDGRGGPVAHIVTQPRTPSQVEADEHAGNWIPTSYMWISNPWLVDAYTDVADVIVATGLMVLVDDCIRDRWQIKKPARRQSAADRPHQTPFTGTESSGQRSRSGLRGFFSRRSSAQHSHSPLRMGKPVAAY